ncbi:gamma-glutamylcyclotransferase family protein [Kordiimonas aquimaris]|uniref:gamma-glutamylcyclotransferase family protein n=1 Tax=Kordiimonas aquimaris TaxID=707591 RepID=UPI0021D0968B|nr:gamma-glutamylcyclotransferase family protein [Kordiimonas aquimaris]
MHVFFYGLFMDEALLAEKGIIPNNMLIGYVDGYALHIGERATLLPAETNRSYGIMMDISADEAADLYSDSSVSDYIPEPVEVVLSNGGKAKAICYNLPAEKVTGANKKYAALLLDVASKLGFPDSYLNHIKHAGT